MKSLIFGLLIASVVADVYMHVPRGSNNRMCETNTNTRNNNRLFDSQNNNKGGYCYGPAMSYYEGSQMNVEWTNQHGCGQDKLKCNIVIQYMCSESDAEGQALVRDGSCTGPGDNGGNNDGTAEIEEGDRFSKNANGEFQYGMHEPFENYKACTTRSRNYGLYTADQGFNNNKKSAKYTRQDNAGTKYGFECPEERDYYPYWHNSYWIDAGVLTEDTDWCDFYQRESQNVKSKYECWNGDEPQEPNNEQACTAAGHEWREFPANGHPAPKCVKAPWSRHNQLGGGLTGYANTFNFTLPRSGDLDCISSDNCNCVLRLRYNISVGDIGTHSPASGFLDSSYNDEQSPIKDDQVSSQDGLEHHLALDTSQTGRTFQDRSYVWHIKPRPSGVPPAARIFNLNVKGKRGNIVQTYPATEYDFTPTNMDLRVGDYVHFQWTGCDHNPNGNAGEGTEGTDRSNIVELAGDFSTSVPATDEWLEEHGSLFDSKDTRIRMAYLNQDTENVCKTYAELKERHGNNENAIEQDGQNCGKLNAAAAYFDGGLVKMNKTGEHYFMSSRNNNFSNRGQKGFISTQNLLPTWAIAVVTVGAVAFAASVGVAGAMMYARAHPHSPVASYLAKA